MDPNHPNYGNKNQKNMSQNTNQPYSFRSKYTKRSSISNRIP